MITLCVVDPSDKVLAGRCSDPSGAQCTGNTEQRRVDTSIGAAKTGGSWLSLPYGGRQADKRQSLSFSLTLAVLLFLRAISLKWCRACT